MLVDNSTWDYKFLFQFWDVLNIDYNTLEIELNWNKKMMILEQTAWVELPNTAHVQFRFFA